MLAVFVDFDGTITDVDTFDALVRAVAGDAAWEAIDGPLVAGRITLREALARQAAAVGLSRAETLAFMEANARVDPAFGPFVAAVRAHGGAIRVVSSGIAPVIHDALARAGVEVDVIANDVDFAAGGWTMSFVDASDNGHDKAAHVRAARASGRRTVYIGDGISDFAAALEADVRFAKKGRALEAYCRARGVACEPFESFSTIERRLFGP
ncbi:MAG: MtnX-like HAD-IB family phosphatase [Candidatus Lustribacter sp.]